MLRDDGRSLMRLAERVVPAWWEPEIRADAMQAGIARLLEVGVAVADRRAGAIVRHAALDEWRRQRSSFAAVELTGLEIDTDDKLGMLLAIDTVAGLLLDDRQAAVVALLARGYSQREIARLLGVHERTIGRILAA